MRCLTKMSLPLLAASSLCAGLLATAPTPAYACSQRPCRPGRFLPISGEIPSNQRELLWRMPKQFRDGDAGVPTPHLYRVEDGVRTELPITLREEGELMHIVPTMELPAGTELVFEYLESCDTSLVTGDSDPLESFSFTISEAAPLPTTLGELVVVLKTGPVEVNVGTGACSASVAAAYADLSVTLSNEASLYEDVLRYELVVDGVPAPSYAYDGGPYMRWPELGASMVGRGRDRVFVVCDTDFYPALTPGAHRVQMVGLLPDGTRVASDEVEIVLTCPLGDAPDGGVHGGDEVLLDAGSHEDAAIVHVDAGEALGTGPDASLGEGCAAASGKKHTSSSPWLTLLALSALLVRRRATPLR